MSNDADFDDVAEKAQPSRARWYILLALLVPFSVLSYLAVNSAPGDSRDRPAFLVALATITGPFIGAIARHVGNPCCLSFSFSVAAVCGPFLALGLIAQVVPIPFRRGQQALRLVLWTLGWFVWLAGGPVSFLHALF